MSIILGVADDKTTISFSTLSVDCVTKCSEVLSASKADLKGLTVGIPDEYYVEELPQQIIDVWNTGITWLRDAGTTLVASPCLLSSRKGQPMTLIPRSHRRSRRPSVAADDQARDPCVLHHCVRRGIVQPVAIRRSALWLPVRISKDTLSAKVKCSRVSPNAHAHFAGQKPWRHPR